MVDLS